MTVRLLRGDCREVLKTLPDDSVHCCVTSPPYWGLRSYLPAGHPDKHANSQASQIATRYLLDLKARVK